MVALNCGSLNSAGPTVRTPDEIYERIELLTTKISDHDIWIYQGNCQIPEPNSQYKKEILKSELLALKWVIGINNEIE